MTQLPHHELILVEGTHRHPLGYFEMGDEHGDLWDACRPVHKVSLPDFFIGKYPVTQALWRAVAEAAPASGLNPEPARFAGDDRPDEQVSWDDITKKFLPALQKLTGKPYRLPTEAEWEYAAREGKNWQDGYRYAGSDRLKDVGWYDENSGGMTRPVGLLQPNQLGLHDMSGNVWEWCSDWYDSEYYQKCLKKGIIDNPPGAERGSYRVLRGGSWRGGALHCRAAYRDRDGSGGRWLNLGFRLALQSVG